MENSYSPKSKEHQLAHALLDGRRGLEIGAAAHNPFGLNTRNVAAPDDFEFYANESRRVYGIDSATVEVWAYAWDIPVPDRGEDFIISSHVIEHLPDLITTFIEWDRITRDPGYIFIIAPLKGALAEDESRELTPLEHFIADYKQKLNLDTHPTEGVPGGRMGHYHTFTPDSLLAVVEYMRTEQLCDWRLIAREDIDTKSRQRFHARFSCSARTNGGTEVCRSARDGDTL